jgi:hypothetical protein
MGIIPFSLLVDPYENANPYGYAHECCTNLLIDGYYTILYLLILMAMLMNTVLLIDGYYVILYLLILMKMLILMAMLMNAVPIYLLMGIYTILSTC